MILLTVFASSWLMLRNRNQPTRHEDAKKRKNLRKKSKKLPISDVEDAGGRVSSAQSKPVISLDSSIIPAILIFFLLIFALNSLLFRPLMRVQAERESRTSGLLLETQKKIDHHLDLFSSYQATLKNARMQGYRHQEQVRAQAMKKRAEVLESARLNAEKLIQDSRAAIQSQVVTAKEQLGRDAREIARSIVSTILQRS